NMTKNKQNELTKEQQEELIETLKSRFEDNMHRHKDFNWNNVQEKLEANTEKLWSLHEMERTGGEPDEIEFDEENDQYILGDGATESPRGRRRVCDGREGLESRRKYKREKNASDMAADMGIELLTEEDYRKLQKLEHVDMKTSSWIQTPAAIRKL